MQSGDYPTLADYIRGEYGKELPVIHDIVQRHIVKAAYSTEGLDAMVLDIVGYYTGCLKADGTPRTHHRAERP